MIGLLLSSRLKFLCGLVANSHRDRRNRLALATTIALVKSFIAYKFSDRPWIIVSISTIVSYLSFVALLSCLYWFWLGFR
jgi:hypothetical protein